MTAFSAIDLSQLPPPDVVKPLDYETIRASIIERFRLQCAEKGIEFDAFVESDPAIILIEAAAYEVLLNRATSNDDARSIMLAFAEDADLDQIAANMQVFRRVIVPADQGALPPVEAVMESDDDLRRRAQLSPESWTNAGTEASYIFHALIDEIVDASATSPVPGNVLITVLGVDQITPPALVDAVAAVFQEKTLRQLGDNVTVQAATVLETDITAELTLYSGPAEATVLAAANARLDALIEDAGKLSRDLTQFLIMGALAVEGVQNVNLISPAADVIADEGEAVRVTNRSLIVVARDV